MNENTNDYILIGAGIMSATLAVFLKELEPNCSISIFECLDKAAQESTAVWNNAGTGHSAFCELNYTPEDKNGNIEVQKAIKIAENFEISKQFWSFLVSEKKITLPENFIHSMPHLSFVWGKEHVDFLKKRQEAMQKNPLFQQMEFSSNPSQLQKWMPLIMKNRLTTDPVAATFMPLGTDVNFENLSLSMFQYLENQPGVTIYYNHKVKKIKQKKEGHWQLKIKNLTTATTFKTISKFVFIGAGGASLLLLEKANIAEGEGYGGFPISGLWLKCNNTKVIEQHHAKVYGKANVGAPPMSVPHLDSRIINGKKELLFGPFAGFSTKFLKSGSYLDLIRSIETENIFPMLSAGYHNVALTTYLLKQVLLNHDDRIDSLREYMPSAKASDWQLLQAGQRVQVIKKDKTEGGILEFGTEVITHFDGSLAALLGASPGASTAVSIMIDLLSRCFSDQMKSPEWQFKLKKMIPSLGTNLNEDALFLKKIRHYTHSTLKLEI